MKKNYYSESFKKSLKTIYGKNGLIKYYGYILAELFGRLLILPGLIFNQSDVRFSKIISRNEKIYVHSTFNTVGDQKVIFKEFQTLLLTCLMFLAGVLGIGLIGGALFFLGYSIGLAFNITPYALLGLLFAIPAILFLVGFIVMFILTYSSRSYVIDTYRDMNVSEVLRKSREVMKKGKGYLFLTNFLTLLVYGTWIFLNIMIYSIIGNAVMYSSGKASAGFGAAFFAVLVFALIFLLFILPVFSVARRLTNEAIYEDATEEELVTSPNVKVIKAKSFTETREELLAKMDQLFKDSTNVNETVDSKDINNDEEVIEENQENDLDSTEASNVDFEDNNLDAFGDLNETEQESTIDEVNETVEEKPQENSLFKKKRFNPIENSNEENNEVLNDEVASVSEQSLDNINEEDLASLNQFDLEEESNNVDNEQANVEEPLTEKTIDEKETTSKKKGLFGSLKDKLAKKKDNKVIEDEVEETQVSNDSDNQVSETNEEAESNLEETSNADITNFEDNNLDMFNSIDESSNNNEEVPVEETPVEESPVEESPVEESPVEETSDNEQLEQDIFQTKVEEDTSENNDNKEEE